MLGKISLLLPQGPWRKLSINIASLFSVQVANYILPLLTIPYVSRIIGPEKLGLLNFSMSYNHYFVLFINFGFDLSVVRLIAARRNDKEYVNNLFNEVITAKVILLVIATIVFILITLNNSLLKQHLLLHCFTCFYCFGVALFPLWLYQGMEDLSQVAIFNFLSKLVITISALLFIKNPSDYIFQNLAMSFAHFVFSIVSLYLAIKKYALKYKFPSFKSIQDRFKNSYTLFLSSLATTLYGSSHVFILGILSTSYAVGIFSAASRVEMIVRVFIYMALNQALFPMIANAFGKTKEKGLNIVNRVSPFLISITLLIAMFIYLSAPILVDFLYGDKFNDAVSVLKVLSVLPILISINSLLGLHVMLNLHMDKAYLCITSLVAVFGQFINYFCIISNSYMGAAWAWVITEAIVVISFYFYLKINKIDVIKFKYLVYTKSISLKK